MLSAGATGTESNNLFCTGIDAPRQSIFQRPGRCRWYWRWFPATKAT